MKKFLKKMAAVAAVTAMNIGLGAMPVYADELQQDFNDEIIENEANYYICDELADENIGVEEIIEKVEIMYENGEISRELADDMIDTWTTPVSRASVTYYNNVANDFFAAAKVNVGTRMFSGDTVDIHFHSQNGYEFSFLNDSSVEDNVVIGNAVPSLTYSDIFSTELTNGGYTLFLNNCVASEDGYLLKFTIRAVDNRFNSNLNLSGTSAYEQLREYVTIEGNKILSDNVYNHIGSLGDLNNDGYVNIEDKQILSYYLINELSLDYIQLAAADVDNNGLIDIDDYSDISQYITAYHTSFGGH